MFSLPWSKADRPHGPCEDGYDPTSPESVKFAEPRDVVANELTILRRQAATLEIALRHRAGRIAPHIRAHYESVLATAKEQLLALEAGTWPGQQALFVFHPPARDATPALPVANSDSRANKMVPTFTGSALMGEGPTIWKVEPLEGDSSVPDDWPDEDWSNESTPANADEACDFARSRPECVEDGGSDSSQRQCSTACEEDFWGGMQSAEAPRMRRRSTAIGHEADFVTHCCSDVDVDRHGYEMILRQTSEQSSICGASPAVRPALFSDGDLIPQYELVPVEEGHEVDEDFKASGMHSPTSFARQRSDARGESMLDLASKAAPQQALGKDWEVVGPFARQRSLAQGDSMLDLTSNPALKPFGSSEEAHDEELKHASPFARQRSLAHDESMLDIASRAVAQPDATEEAHEEELKCSTPFARQRSLAHDTSMLDIASKAPPQPHESEDDLDDLHVPQPFGRQRSLAKGESMVDIASYAVRPSGSDDRTSVGSFGTSNVGDGRQEPRSPNSPRRVGRRRTLAAGPSMLGLSAYFACEPEAEGKGDVCDGFGDMLSGAPGGGVRLGECGEIGEITLSQDSLPEFPDGP